jgi:hypothetical protein
VLLDGDALLFAFRVRKDQWLRCSASNL